MGYNFVGANKKVEFICRLVSNSGKFEDYDSTFTCKNCYIDSEYEDEGGSKRNLLVEYGQGLDPQEVPEDDIWLVQEAIAKAAKQHTKDKDEEETFDIQSAFPKYVPPEKRVLECGYDHTLYDETDPKVGPYHALPHSAYFDENNIHGFMHGSVCRDCGKQIVHKLPSEADAKDFWVVTPGHQVHVCLGLYQNKIESCKTCGVVCDRCFLMGVVRQDEGKRPIRSRRRNK